MDVDNYGAPAPEPATTTGNLTVHNSRLVIGDRGAGWMVESWDMFKAAPVQWLVFTLVGFVIVCIISITPFVNLINGLFTQIWIGGVMVACHAQHRGEAVKVSHLFAGFGPKATKLLLSQLAVIGLQMVIALPLVGSIVYDLYQSGALLSDDPQAILAQIDTRAFLLRTLIAVALLMPVMAAGWFAPALILLGGKGVKEALWLSMVGCFKNSWPFVIYGICTLILCLLALVTLGLAFLVLVPIFYISLYLSFRDIYID